MNKMDIAVRSYVKEKKQKSKWKPPEEDYVEYDRDLVFDTETTTDQYQNLLFGSFQIYERGKLDSKGLFFGESVSEKDKITLETFGKENGIPLFSRKDFIDRFFYPEVHQNHSMCIGFNLPFDISRLAIHYGPARKSMKGGFSFKLSEDPFNPMIAIKHLDSTKSLYRFNHAKNQEIGNMRHRKGRTNTFQGKFQDLRTLSFSLTNEKFTLRTAGEHFNCDVLKNEVESHGKITPEYIRYNINDVEATYSLYLKLKEEYRKYNLDIPIHKILSPASMGKGYLKQMGIKPFTDKNPAFPPEILGNVMTTYFGGRSEVKIRKHPTQISYIDVLSMYPTVNILQGLWDFVVCDHVDLIDDTDTVREFLEDVSLDALKEQSTWKHLKVICLIDPNEDILPVRAHYGSKNVFNIGINYLTSDKGIWYSLSDVVASKLLTGKIPKISKAVRFDPVGIQENLHEIEILNSIKFDPTKQDLFKILIEERKRIKFQIKKLTGLNLKPDDTVEISEFEIRKLDSEQLILKIITNSTSYGIFYEINTNEKSETLLEIFGLGKFETRKNKIEENGSMFNPIMGAFITSGARLFLAITERILMDHGETYAFCDTDSMAVPVERVKEIQNYFRSLNPYDFDAEIFEMEKENFVPINWNDPKGDSDETKPFPLWFFGISAKRYVLYNLKDGIPVIRKYSSHGLGHLLNPFKDDDTDKYWHERIWEDILSIEYGQKTHEDVLESYNNRYAMSKLGMTSPQIMKRFKVINKGKAYKDQIKPFNFAIVGTARENRKHTLDDIKPLIPFTKRYHTAPYKPFIDYHTGDLMEGIRYWKPMKEVIWEYYTHPESKFDGSVGILERKHIQVDEVIHIGKESNKLEETDILGVDRNGYSIYDKGLDLVDKYGKEFLLSIGPKMAKEIGLSRGQLYTVKNKIR